MDYQKYQKLEFRRKFFKLLGAEITVSEPDSDAVVGFIEMKAWKLREDIRLYSDRSKSQELLRIRARTIVDLGATYDIFTNGSETPVFSVRRQGLKSAFVRDHWTLLDASGAEIGDVQETGTGLSLLRRYINLVPFIGWALDLILYIKPVVYTITDKAGLSGGIITQHKNPFIVKFGLDTTDAKAALDPRLPVAIVTLMSVIDAGKD